MNIGGVADQNSHSSKPINFQNLHQTTKQPMHWKGQPNSQAATNRTNSKMEPQISSDHKSQADNSTKTTVHGTHWLEATTTRDPSYAAKPNWNIEEQKSNSS